MLDGVDGQLHALAILPPWKRPGIHCTASHPGLVWTVAKFLAPPLRLNLWIIQPLASHYTDWYLTTHFWCGHFGSNETTSHPPKHLHVLYRLWVSVGYSVCTRVCIRVSVFAGRDCSAGALRHDSFVTESEDTYPAKVSICVSGSETSI